METINLLQKWLSIIADNKATVKAEPVISKNTRISDLGETNSKFIAGLIKETVHCLESPLEISPYNPAHAEYGDCCGIFNQINDDGILCCNECGVTINKLIDHIILKTHYQGKVSDDEIEKEAVLLAKKHAKQSVGDFAVGFNWGAKLYRVIPCDKDVRDTLHIILSKVDIDKDNLDYIKANEEICGKLRWDLVERISNYIKNMKDE